MNYEINFTLIEAGKPGRQFFDTLVAAEAVTAVLVECTGLDLGVCTDWLVYSIACYDGPTVTFVRFESEA